MCAPRLGERPLFPSTWGVGNGKLRALNASAVLMNASAVLMNASNECRGVPPARNVFAKVQKIKNRRFLCVCSCVARKSISQRQKIGDSCAKAGP